MFIDSQFRIAHVRIRVGNVTREGFALQAKNGMTWCSLKTIHPLMPWYILNFN